MADNFKTRTFGWKSWRREKVYIFRFLVIDMILVYISVRHHSSVFLHFLHQYLEKKKRTRHLLVANKIYWTFSRLLFLSSSLFNSMLCSYTRVAISNEKIDSIFILKFTHHFFIVAFFKTHQSSFFNFFFHHTFTSLFSSIFFFKYRKIFQRKSNDPCYNQITIAKNTISHFLNPAYLLNRMSKNHPPLIRNIKTRRCIYLPPSRVKP